MASTCSQMVSKYLGKLHIVAECMKIVLCSQHRIQEISLFQTNVYIKEKPTMRDWVYLFEICERPEQSKLIACLETGQKKKSFPFSHCSGFSGALERRGLGVMLAYVGVMLAYVGVIFGVFCSILALCWLYVGLSWLILAQIAQLGSTWPQLGPNLAQLGLNLAPTWLPGTLQTYGFCIGKW